MYDYYLTILFLYSYFICSTKLKMSDRFCMRYQKLEQFGTSSINDLELDCLGSREARPL